MIRDRHGLAQSLQVEPFNPRLLAVNSESMYQARLPRTFACFGAACTAPAVVELGTCAGQRQDWNEDATKCYDQRLVECLSNSGGGKGRPGF